jgi:hypothetical protein
VGESLKRNVMRLLMNLREQIDSHEYLCLSEIGEPKVNVLRVVVDEAKASNDANVEIPDTPFMGNPIVSDDTCRRYEITFLSYVAYAVLNESFAKVDDYEQYTGRYFRIYSKSHFLDYVAAATFASDDYPGKATHYEIACLDHIVEVVSAEEPQVREHARA